MLFNRQMLHRKFLTLVLSEWLGCQYENKDVKLQQLNRLKKRMLPRWYLVKYENEEKKEIFVFSHEFFLYLFNG